jgi:hypothetical protein
MQQIGKGKAGPGRPKGIPNKVTRAAKEAFAHAFEQLGGTERMVQWAKSDPENLKVFYTLYARLIPLDVTSGEETLHITMEVIGGG